MIKKGIVLAGGSGTRMMPLTSINSKHLLPIGMLHMIDYPIKTLLDLGIKDIMIITGKEHSGKVFEYLGSGNDYHAGKCSFTYRIQDKAGGIAEALLLVEEWSGDNDIAVILGDNYFSPSCVSYIKDLMNIEFDKSIGLITKEVNDPERFGVFYDGKIIEKPKNPKSNQVVTGLYFYSRDVWSAIKEVKYSDRGEMEITDLNNKLLKDHNSQIIELKDGDFWRDMGTQTTYKEVNDIVWSELLKLN